MWALAAALSIAAAASQPPPAHGQARSPAASADTIPIRLIRRVGMLDGPPEYAFGEVARLKPTADGGFYLCDYQDRVIRRYREDGTFVRQVGRRGAGPAEYADCGTFDLAPDGSLLVNDPQNARIVRFRDDGSFDDVVGVSVYPGFSGENTFMVGRDGRIWKRGARQGQPPVPGEGEFGGSQFVILSPEGARLDSVLTPKGAGNRLGMGFALSTNDGMYYHLPSDTVWALMPDGSFAVAGIDAYRIEVRRAGRPPLVLRRDSRPVRYTREERAQWEAWREYFSRRQRSRPIPPIPDEKPVIRELRVADDGAIWVKVHVAAEARSVIARPPGDARPPRLAWRERPTWDLFDGTTGADRGRVVLPWATELAAARGDRIWLGEEGESGERLIGIYEMQRAPRR